VIDKDTTMIIGGRGKAVAVEQRCDEIRRQIKDTTSNYGFTSGLFGRSVCSSIRRAIRGV
jgi:hypothetical protein